MADINKLFSQLETEINTRMDEFSKVGAQAKKLQKEAKIKQDRMIEIYNELKPVHAIIREQNPKYKELFDAMEGLL